jgi:hypothetical protein
MNDRKKVTHPKKEIKVKVNMTFEEVMKKALNTPLPKRKKKSN